MCLQKSFPELRMCVFMCKNCRRGDEYDHSYEKDSDGDQIERK